MKETYFTDQNIRQKALEMVRQAGGRKLAFAPARSALLVLDMQRFFLDPASHAFIPSAKAVVPRIKTLAETYARNGLPVVFTRHVNTAANAGLMSKWWRDLIREQDPLSEITNELDPSMGVILKKTQYDAFYDTALEELLTAGHVTQLVICGVMTNLCCETTARSAFVRGFEVFFCVDGTAAYNESFHLASIRNLSFGFAVPVCIDEITTALEGGNAR